MYINPFYYLSVLISYIHMSNYQYLDLIIRNTYLIN